MERVECEMQPMSRRFQRISIQVQLGLMLGALQPVRELTGSRISIG